MLDEELVAVNIETLPLEVVEMAFEVADVLDEAIFSIEVIGCCDVVGGAGGRGRDLPFLVGAGLFGGGPVDTPEPEVG